MIIDDDRWWSISVGNEYSYDGILRDRHEFRCIAVTACDETDGHNDGNDYNWLWWWWRRRRRRCDGDNNDNDECDDHVVKDDSDDDDSDNDDDVLDLVYLFFSVSSSTPVCKLYLTA